MRRIYGITAAVVCLSTPLHALEPDTNQFLMDACEKENGAFESGYCLGAILAYRQLVLVQCAGRDEVGFNLPLAAAVPDNVTNGALVQIFINWARANPKEWAGVSLLGVTTAFAEAYPCPLIN